MCCVLPTEVTISLDVVLVILDVVFDYLLIASLFQEDHVKWAIGALFFTLLPGVIAVLAMVLDSGIPKTRKSSCHYLMFIIIYPLAICWFALRTMKDSSQLAFMIHIKSYEGLIEASFQFLIQIIIIQTRTPVGHMEFFGQILPNGDFFWRVLNTCLSFLSFIFGVCRYHCLLDKSFDCLPVLKVMPFFLINILFRTFTTSLFFVYIPPPYITFPFLMLIGLGIINIFLTYNTIQTTIHRSSHKIFSCLIGGIISILSPAFGAFYGEGAKGKTVKHYYKINILVTNIILIMCFGILSVHMNVFATSVDGIRVLNRYPALGCHEANHTWCGTEFGFSTCDQIVPVVDGFPFLGHKLEVRDPSEREKYVNLFSDEFYEEEFQPRYLVAQLCQDGQSPAQNFNFLAVPLVCGLFILSTLSAVFIERCGISFKNEQVENEETY